MVLVNIGGCGGVGTKIVHGRWVKQRQSETLATFQGSQGNSSGKSGCLKIFVRKIGLTTLPQEGPK